MSPRAKVSPQEFLVEVKYNCNTDVCVCDMCGLIKPKTDFFGKEEAKRRTTQNGSCRVCCFMKEHKLGLRNCECCGETKPNAAFPKHGAKPKHCRPCLNKAMPVAKSV